MECHPCDSKKLLKVFDASKRKRSRRRGDADEKSVCTDESTSAAQAHKHVTSAKASLQDLSAAQNTDALQETDTPHRERISNASVTQRSPRRGRHRKLRRNGLSLALKAGLVSTPRSISPLQQGGKGLSYSPRLAGRLASADAVIMFPQRTLLPVLRHDLLVTSDDTHEKRQEGAIRVRYPMDNVDNNVGHSPKDQDSLIYAFLEQAVKRDKKKQRHEYQRRLQEERNSPERDACEDRDTRRHHHRRKREENIRLEPRDRSPKAENTKDAQTKLLETFAKLCKEITGQSTHKLKPSYSHKSLQYETTTSKRDLYEAPQKAPRMRTHVEKSCENLPPSRVRSHDNVTTYSQERLNISDKLDNHGVCYEISDKKRSNTLIDCRSRMHHIFDREEKYPDYYHNTQRYNDIQTRDYKGNRNYYDKRHRQQHDDDRRRYCDRKASRNFEVTRDYDDDIASIRTYRNESMKGRRYDDKRYEDRVQRNKYYEDIPEHDNNYNDYVVKEHRSRKKYETFQRNSIKSRNDDYREKDRYSEGDRDSGLSVADDVNSTMSGRSNYLRAMKQEIAEQREAMDKMMKLWKELMRCFKTISQTQIQERNINESAANARESAAEQLRLWRECMRRYETVARDVGDTDARLMEEINKQRLEMAEMAAVWQECLQRYRDMSNDFNSLKQQVTSTHLPAESPSRIPATPLSCAEGEGPLAPSNYRFPPGYPPMPPIPMSYGMGGAGSPLRARASVPPAWWWGEGPPQDTPRRRSSPESRDRHRDRERDRDRNRKHRHKEREREDPRYKEKSKPSAGRLEHRHRKR